VSRPLVLHCLDGLGVGGAERQLTLLLRHRPREAFDHAVSLVGPRREMVPEVEALGVPVYELSAGRRQPAQAVFRLVRLARRLRPALLHADHDYGKLCARAAAAWLRTPLLATVGNTLVSSSSSQQPGRLLREARQRLLAHVSEAAARWTTDHYLAISETVRRDLIAHGVDPSRITVIPRGVDLEEYAPAPAVRLAALRAALLPDGAGPVLLNVGRLVNQKGQETLIRAMPAIRQVHPRATLLLAGDGPNRDGYQALAAREGVTEAVVLLGVRRDVKELLHLADVFVFPSVREGTGVALLEAMAAARPCVTSRLPVLEEVLGTGGAGEMVPPRRPDLLAAMVLALLADPPRRDTMGRLARRRVEQHYDSRRSAAAFAELCRGMLDARVGREAVSVA
jgi:glycosyltransferase involved in cell wall biosynthesis